MRHRRGLKKNIASCRKKIASLKFGRDTGHQLSSEPSRGKAGAKCFIDSTRNLLETSIKTTLVEARGNEHKIFPLLCNWAKKEKCSDETSK